MNIIEYIKRIIKWIHIIASDKVPKSALAQLYSQSYSLTPTVTKGDAYKTVTINHCVLCGNVLKIAIDATRSSATSAGNISNEIIATLKIPTNDLFDGYYTVSGISGGTGHISIIRNAGASFANGYFTVSIYLVATHTTQTAITGTVLIPIRRTVRKFY